MSKEAKVGAFTLVGTILLALILAHLNGFSFGTAKSYRIYATFSQVIGLNPDAEVRIAGVPAGRVKSIVNEGRGVRVELLLDADKKVEKDAKVTLAMAGMLGDKFINIRPGNGESGYLEDGDYIAGSDENSVEDMMAQAAKVTKQVQELLQSLNDIVGNPEFKTAMLDISVNVRDTTANMRLLTETMANMAVQNQSQINDAVSKLNAMMTNLMMASAQVNNMMTDFNGDGQTAANLREAVANITAASRSIEHMASNLEGVVGDKQTADDLKHIIHNARELTEHSNAMMGSLSSIKVKPSVETMYSGGKNEWMTDFDVDIYSNQDSFLTLGVDDIGEENAFKAQLGKKKGSLGARAGVMDDQAGVGLDAYAGDRWKFSADAYDFNNARVKLRAQYQLNNNTYLIGQINDVNSREKRATYFGVRQTF